MHITPKSLEVAKTPEEHKLLSKLSKVKSLWEGNDTHGLQGHYPDPETIEELDPTMDVKLEGKGAIGHSVPDGKLLDKREAWVSEKDNTEVVRMAQDELDESVGESPNNTASLTEDNSVLSSETVGKEERPSSSVPVASDEKLEDQSGECNQEHLPKSEQRPPSDAKASMTSEEIPKQKPTRRGGRGRKPKGPGHRHNENASRTPEKQEKSSAGNATKSKNTPTRSRPPKGSDNFRGDVPKASPKNPKVERPEGSKGDAPSAYGGAESALRQFTRNVETSEKGGGEKGTADANKQDHVKNTSTGNPANSPGDSSKGGMPGRGRRRPRSRTSKGVPDDEKQDSKTRSNSNPEKRPPKKS